MAFLLSSVKPKRTIKENCDAYRPKLFHQRGGDFDAARQKAREEKQPLAPHSWGPKKTLNIAILLRCLKQAAQDWADDQCKACDDLSALTAEQKDVDVSSCQSKFRRPTCGSSPVDPQLLLQVRQLSAFVSPTYESAVGSGPSNFSTLVKTSLARDCFSRKLSIPVSPGLCGEQVLKEIQMTDHGGAWRKAGGLRGVRRQSAKKKLRWTEESQRCVERRC